MKKITLMLVDDDDLMLQDLKAMVDWDSLGFKIVCMANNGKKALSLFKQNCPTFVITDIAMPVMDGLDMIDCILKQQPDTYLLILTSYDEFSYAKRALDSGVKNYILKNELSPAALTEKLIKIREHLSEDSRIVQQSHQAALREYFRASDIHFTELPPSLQIWNVQSLYYILITFTLPFEVTVGNTDVYEMGRELYQIIKTMDPVTYRIPVFFHMDNIAVMGIKPNQPVANKLLYLRHLIRKMTLHIGDALFGRIIVFYGNNSRTLDKIREDVLIMRPLIEFYTRIYAGHPLELDEIKLQNVVKSVSSFPFGNIAYKSVDPNHLKALYKEHLQALLHCRDIEGMTVFHINACSYYESLCENRLSFKEPYYYRGLEEYLDWHADAYSRSMEALREVWVAGWSMPVKKAIDYMNIYCSNSNLTSDKIAEQVGLSAGRLSVLFKQETGRTINEFLTDIRMKMAIRLLEDSRYKIYEIAEMVGYKSSQYFSQIFYQKTGRRPIDYKKLPN